MKKCENCDYARHSKSDKVGCALLNNHEELARRSGLSESKLAEDEGLAIRTIYQLFPNVGNLYRGWAYPHRRFGDRDATGLGSGILWNDFILTEPTSHCAGWEPIRGVPTEGSEVPAKD